MAYLALLVVPFALLLGAWIIWRLVSRRRSLPCPTTLAFLLDNPFTAGYHSTILSRLELSKGLQVLDAGCGPGFLTIPIARAVHPAGRVWALDIQPGMVARAEARARQAGLSNIEFIVAGLGEGRLPPVAFDRAVMVTVLGEISDKLAALREIYSSLKPGGFLSITEVLPDPHYQPLGRVEDLAAQAGFRTKKKFGNWFLFTVNMEKPNSA